ncbi:MAG TPA: hypothetical protein VGM20_12055 [Gemmatimonadales bacterium]|jgi:hypothetical protein
MSRRVGRLLQQLRAAWGVRRAPPTIRRRDDALHAMSCRRDPARARISAETARDLLLDEILDAIDNSLTTLGRQALYARLRSLPDAAERDELERAIANFATSAEEREKLQLLLMRLGDRSDLWDLTDPDAVPAPSWMAWLPVLSIALVGSAVMVPFWPRAFLVLVPLVFAGIWIRHRLFTRTAHVIAPLRALGGILDVARELSGQAGLASPRRGERIAQALGVLLPLRAPLLLVGLQGTGNELLDGLWEYLNIVLLLDANAMVRVSRALRHHRDALFEVLAFVGDTDVAQSIASLRARPEQWSCPTITAEPGYVVTDAWHPLLPDAIRNSITIGQPAGVLITGSNMSGKSTWLRTFGTVVLLARTVNTVPATGYRGPASIVCSGMRSDDDLESGKSSYLSQAERVVAMIKESGELEPRMFLLDEVFRGTNTNERIAAAEGVLRELLRSRDGQPSPHVVIAATHDGELVDLLAGLYLPYHFTDAVVDGQLVFHHRLTPGPAQSRSALLLLELLGAPPEMMEAARHRADLLDQVRTTGLYLTE